MRQAAGARCALSIRKGGGALGAYQWGVYEALHDAGIEPAWVIGTSIGAINAGLIAGNERAHRIARLRRFWSRVEQHVPAMEIWDGLGFGLGQMLANLTTVSRGVSAFFEPNPTALRGTHAAVGVEQAAFYSAEPLHRTLTELVDLPTLRSAGTRLTLGAVNACSGRMRYFDSREQALSVDHIMASGALPPAFAAVRIDGEPYWDGGLYSNTPIEAVLDDNPRRDALIFAVNVWHEAGPEPQSIWQVMGRQKDVQYASRAESHIVRQKQIHRLRHVIRQLSQQLPARRRGAADVKALAAWGCSTTMHVVHLAAPRLDGEDHAKDIDFTRAGLRARRTAGYADTLRMIERAPWQAPVDPIEGIVEHR